MTKRSILVVCTLLAVLATAALWAAAAKPSTVIHIVTIKWKADATPEQISGALKAAETMQYPGLVRVWTRTIKKQLPEGYGNIIVMEFKNEQALKDYSGSEAQKAWYKVYMPIREESRTHDVTN